MPFDNAYNNTMGHEGGYVFDPDDKGGETYKGISRVYWPIWTGWAIIDTYKPFKNKDYSAIYADKELDSLTRKFYKKEFWDVNSLDDIDEISSLLSEKIFDTGVNVGVRTAGKWLQSSLNLLNRNQKNYPDIKVDGIVGPGTVGTLKASVSCNPINRILTVFAIHQGSHYKVIMEKNPTQEKYVGWFDRLTYK